MGDQGLKPALPPMPKCSWAKATALACRICLYVRTAQVHFRCEAVSCLELPKCSEYQAGQA